MQVVPLRGSNLIEVQKLHFSNFEFYILLTPNASLFVVLNSISFSIFVFIKVMDAHGEKSLALFPTKFQNSMWIKRGLYHVISNSKLWKITFVLFLLIFWSYQFKPPTIGGDQKLSLIMTSVNLLTSNFSCLNLFSSYLKNQKILTQSYYGFVHALGY